MKSAQFGYGISYYYELARNATYGYSSCPVETIGTNYNHTSYMHSHMMKNSEWGAVAYLTHSQYGRNGNQLDVNNCSVGYTGNGAGSTSSVSRVEEITNAYNTELGVKASSTGNIFGIYDLVGGQTELVAVFNKLGSSISENSGEIITQEATDGNGNYISTKYVTTYSNDTNTYYGNNVLYSAGKTGDATKEVNRGGGYAISTSRQDNCWGRCGGYIVSKITPYLLRGSSFMDSEGIYGGSIFTSKDMQSEGSTFRAVLVP